MSEGNYNIYYEMPGSGGNLKCHTLADAKEGFTSLVTHYPDCYAKLTGETFAITIEEYDGSQND